MKIGIDIVSISRFKKIKKTDLKKWNKVFSGKEWENSFKKNSSQTLAGIFAAKEAGMKALEQAGADRFSDWEIRWANSGAPLLFHKKRKIGSVSISHEGDVAVAAVVLK